MHGTSLPNSLLRLYVHKTAYVHIEEIVLLCHGGIRIKFAMATVNIEPFAIHN